MITIKESRDKIVVTSPSIGDAKVLLQDLSDMLDKNEYFSLADIYDWCAVNLTHRTFVEADSIRWTSFDGIEVSQNRITFPIYKEKREQVNHPDHYQSNKGIEVIDVIQAFTNDLYGVAAFDTANILKYMCRWDKKNGVEDLKKAKWYLEHLIKYVESYKD